MNNRYPYLPEGRDILHVPADNPFMKEAIEMRNTFSTDKWYPTGAVAVFENKIVAKDANQSKLKNKFLIDFHKNKFCVRKILRIKTGEKYWACPGCATHHQHSESRVAKELMKQGIKGADLYLYGHWWCCKPCWDEMIKADIKDVYLVEGAFELFEKRAHVVAEAIRNSQR